MVRGNAGEMVPQLITVPVPATRDADAAYDRPAVDHHAARLQDDARPGGAASVASSANTTFHEAIIGDLAAGLQDDAGATCTALRLVNSHTRAAKDDGRAARPALTSGPALDGAVIGNLGRRSRHNSGAPPA